MSWMFWTISVMTRTAHVGFVARIRHRMERPVGQRRVGLVVVRPGRSLWRWVRDLPCPGGTVAPVDGSAIASFLAMTDLLRTAPSARGPPPPLGARHQVNVSVVANEAGDTGHSSDPSPPWDRRGKSPPIHSSHTSVNRRPVTAAEMAWPRTDAGLAIVDSFPTTHL